MGDGFGLACLVLNYGSVFTGFLLKLHDGTLFTGIPSMTVSQRYEKNLPGVDIFVCTVGPMLGPPMMVINTVLSVMAHDYPTEKLSVYLSDDAGSDLTFYAQASSFAKYWIPFCKKYKVELKSPAAYFKSMSAPNAANLAKEFLVI
ncbi:Cellulose synthase-like protein [Quillaja saponaria]|uniref:Cellulose synthase-like protein n=1 Tax=Quillaja saponaria TaxID=32244 RepID=A0AAD7LMN7_QUISA|nr:Cellulose synthase-like protein [Quillaja saponaria]